MNFTKSFASLVVIDCRYAFRLTLVINVDNQFLLREGSTSVAHYGIRLAEVAGIPASVVNHARIIAAKIDAKVCILPGADQIMSY